MDGELSPQRSSRTKSLTLSAVDGELSPLASSRRSAAPSAVDGGVRSPQASSGRNPVAPSGAECERSQVVSPKKAAHGVAGGERSEALSPKKSVAFSEPRGPRQ
ncbi:unnamed protein product [Prorocentrum cordatum]|uniref:Uncharacterized protein n=1 Tax=Prorocentrum cordatum TaxID=2364126 RepID=A0ABN9SY38_9DINO|nr:unnamed protein product [Polarella glacialis]